MPDQASMAGTAYMVNGFDPDTAGELDQDMRQHVARRLDVLGPAYKLFYRHPVRFVRAEGVYLYDAEGRAYLDAYNNVPSVGHCHPRVVEAIARQAAMLNVHTRYGTDLLVEYAERLVATFPPEIGNVMFTCTGSEAADLALRVARFATRAPGVIVTSNAYHGVTTAAAEISPSLGPDVPLGPQVRTVAPPDPRRDGTEDAGQAFAARVTRAAADLRRHGIGLAAFVADSLFSSDGIIPGPAGFLRPVVDAVHAAGGIYIADEVQPGFARTGDSMWGFQRHGIVPDLVVMGKPMGNGMPIAGLAARPGLLAEFGRKIRYFNTFGGSSVSVAAASAVLDVIEDEKLAENARAVGVALREAIAQAAAGYPGVTDIRGAGLYTGVEFADPQTGEPDGQAALNVVNELRERRVLISATGAHGNVLKIRPPLPFGYRHVGQFADALRESLASLARRCQRAPSQGALFQDVAAELGKDLRDLAQEVVAVRAAEGAQVLAVPPAAAVIPGGGPVGQRRYFGGEARVQEEREGQPAVAAEVADAVRC
jgi:4-aminobutyrate aminotransferase-like enzyme